MKKNFTTPAQRRSTFRLVLRLGIMAILALSGVGCASFNNDMASAPPRAGVPPYADDPEANGNPEKAWWN